MSGENDKSMKWDRRRQARKAPQSFTFLQLEHDEGGRVVDLSEEGLRFETFSPVRTANPVPLWFSFNLRDRIAATGEVVWTDSRKEVGGLAFINLSPVARQLIREHIAELPAEVAAPQASKTNGERTLAGGSNGETPRVGSLSSVAAPEFTALPRLGELRSPERSAIAAPETSPSEPALTEVPDSADQAPLIPLERFVAATRSQFLRGLLLGIVITMLVGIFVLMYALRSQRGAGGKQAPASSSGVDNPALGSDPPTPKPASSLSLGAAGSSAPSLSAKPAGDAFGSTASPSRKNTPDTLRSQTNGSALPPSSTNASAQAKLNPLTPDQLWEAVQSGNAKAAVALANLYLRGDGVPANCAQARILLQFAAQKNNPEAIKKSRDLEKSGCPAP